VDNTKPTISRPQPPAPTAPAGTPPTLLSTSPAATTKRLRHPRGPARGPGPDQRRGLGLLDRQDGDRRGRQRQRAQQRHHSPDRQDCTTGSISVNGGAAHTNRTDVSLALAGNDGAGSGVAKMRLAATADGLGALPWADFAATAATPSRAATGRRRCTCSSRRGGEREPGLLQRIILDATRPRSARQSPAVRRAQTAGTHPM